MVAPECPVVHANDARRLGGTPGTPPHPPQQGVVADGKHQSLGEARSGATAEREPEVVDDTLQARRSPRASRQDAILEALREDLTATVRGRTAKATRHDPKKN